MNPPVELLDWGVVDYSEALARQRKLFEGLIAAKMRDESGVGWIVLCEHPHVYTLGRSGKEKNLLVSEEFLRSRGASFHRTERGGDITYHGPGQTVVYPILDLERVGLGLREYIAALEQAVIETVAEFGIEAGRVAGKTGVWVGGQRKICAIGVKSSRFVTMHGLALNVATDLEWFEHINPCGMAGSAVTSMERELEREFDREEVKRVLCGRLCANLKVEL
jgi:lipoyl(octanoyl) transferase